MEYNEGLGSYDSGEVDTQHLTKLIVANNDIWCLATNTTKASILAQYLRIFSSPVLRHLCALVYSLLLLSACWGVFAGTFLCSPTEKLWTPELPGHCLDALSYWVSAAAVNSALDLVVLILPLPLIMTLRLPHRQKICISSLFLLGFLVFLVSVIRFATVYVEAVKGDHISMHSSNLSRDLLTRHQNQECMLSCGLSSKSTLASSVRPSSRSSHSLQSGFLHCWRIHQYQVDGGGNGLDVRIRRHHRQRS